MVKLLNPLPSSSPLFLNTRIVLAYLPYVTVLVVCFTSEDNYESSSIFFTIAFILQQGQTALSIAQRLGYISVVETLKVVTETIITTTTTTITEEKYKVVAPETMQETFMSDSEDEGGKLFEQHKILFRLSHSLIQLIKLFAFYH